MLDYTEIKKIRKAYENKKNIMSYLRAKKSSIKNSSEIILYSYDLQAGSYYAARNNKKIKEHNAKIGKKMADIILRVGAKSILEAGIGEGNTMFQLRKNLRTDYKFFGFDISLSRILYAQKFLQSQKKVTLFTADIENIPVSENSVDLIYTTHALEPNYGKEEILLRDLFRVTREYLLLIEPSYELGSKSTRAHIKKHGYVRNLPKIIKKLGHKILIYELGPSIKSNNQAAIILAKKNKKNTFSHKFNFVSPLSQKPLIKHNHFWHCKEDGYAYPVINQIPCLLKENGILASKLSLFS